MDNKKVLIRIQNLTKHFPIRKPLLQRKQLFVQANTDISLDIYEGETFGLVGESGCGKSTLGRVILQLYPQTGGTTLYYGRTLEEFKPRYVKRTIKQLPQTIAQYNQLSEEAKLSDRSKNVVAKYQDALRIAGGLVLADDLAEVSRVLLAEYAAGVAHFPLAQQLHDLTLNKGVLADLGEKCVSDVETVYDKQIRELSSRVEKAKAILDANRAAVTSLRARYASKPGFEALDKLQDEGINLAKLTGEEQRVLRRELQVIFQDPYSSLNPRLTVGQVVSEALTAHNIFKSGSEILEKYVLDIMDKCGLQPYMLHRYPHQFSGGQIGRASCRERV